MTVWRQQRCRRRQQEKEKCAFLKRRRKNSITVAMLLPTTRQCDLQQNMMLFIANRKSNPRFTGHFRFFLTSKFLLPVGCGLHLYPFFLLGNILSSCTSAVLEGGYVIHCSPSFFSIVSETREIINFPSFSPFELWLVFNRGEWYLYISPVVFIPCGGIESVFISSLF